MSEGDVSLIRDEDVLRRMWQQTEDFSRKKEIRAHMYRLREERLRSLHSPEPSPLPKGVAPAMHVASFADQSFQGLKSKEVRDASSPPKEFRADLKELSNAGWNVETENKTTDNGHTQIRGVHASVKGSFDVDGGRGQFAAVDSHREAETEHHDDNTSLHRREAASNTAAHEQVVRQSDDGAHLTSTTSSSSATSKIQQIASTTHEVPYSIDDCDQPRRETSNRNEFTKVTNTNAYEQSLRKSEVENGELISRKVDYPDTNTKIIVETRCLPDGTRVTSTRREFRAPAQSTRSEHHSTRSESKSYSGSSRHTSDKSESSKVTHKYDNYDIVDSQRKADDYDFKRNQDDHTKYDYSQTQQATQMSESKRFDTRESSSKTIQETIDSRNVDIAAINKSNIKNIEQNKTPTKKEFSTTQQTIQYSDTGVNETSQRKVITKNDIKINEKVHTADNNIHITGTKSEKIDRPVMTAEDNEYPQREIEDMKYTGRRDAKQSKILNDQKVDESVKKQTSDQYQTTYQSDYTQKKISNDWSPTHQAWASTLRADSPSTTRPIRESSPGSRTYQPSTTFQRSSMSPDKTCRKPSSRGGSPSKINHSPSRILTDRFSTTSSNHTVSETKTSRYTSPERKSPTSSSRNSTDRKLNDYCQRPTQSPDNYPYEYGPSTSPDRKPCYKSGSPDEYLRYKSPSRTSEGTPRPSPSPERKPFSSSPRMPSPYRSTISPVEQISDRGTKFDKKSGSQKDSQIPTSGYTPTRPNLSATRPSVSPDRKPGYMRPTVSSKAPKSPTSSSPDRKSPAKHTPPSQSPERKYHGKTTHTEDHYMLIDEETKMYTRSKDTTDFCRPESPSLRPSIRKGSRSPSPPKGPVTFTDNQSTKNENIITTATDISTKCNTTDITKINKPKPSDPLVRDSSREPSPSKYGTYDKKRRSEETTSITQEDKHDFLTRRQKTTKTGKDSPSLPPNKSPRNSLSPEKSCDSPRQSSPSKYGTYDKKHRTTEFEDVTVNKVMKDEYDSLTRRRASTRKTPEVSPSPTKKSHQESVSPVKSPTKDPKYKYTTDFIATERTTEETNKTTKHNHPRQLITPSTSPTRKHKDDEMAPSTGQSSPTTSVSGFIYFSSPKTDTTLGTDLDGEEYHLKSQKSEETNTITQTQRPDTLKIKRSPSPSKIPCRSPSPEKKGAPIKESLPRKSSLKKPSSGSNLQSPVEKPPSNFRVSPTDESQDFTEHKIIKKERPDKTVDTPAKTKYPFERRETYEERCLKILGVVDDITKTESKDIEGKRESPDKSPRYSPEPKEDSILTSSVTRKEATKVNVADFISHEKSDIVTKSTLREDRKSKTPSRDSSPTKLQDIISHSNSILYDKTTDVETQDRKKICKSPERDISSQKPTTLRRSQSPKKKLPENPKNSKPAGLSRSPDRNVDRDQLPKKNSPFRSSVSPDRKPSYMKSTTASSTKFESSVTDKQESVSTKVTRTSLDRETGYQNTKDHLSPRSENRRSSSPSKNKECTFPKVRSSPERKYPAGESPEIKPVDKSPSRLSMSPDRKPGDVKLTASRVTKFAESYSMETKSEDSTMKTNDKIHQHSVAISAKETDHPGKKYDAPKYSRTPSPNKKTTKSVEDITQFIQSEREQEILDKVQRSLRKLSPNRDQQSPSREKSPGKTKVSLEDIDVNCTITEKTSVVEQKKLNLTKNDEITTHTTKVQADKPRDPRPISKLATRTVSPVKKPTTSSLTKPEKNPTSKSPESPNISRSISPKKPASPTSRSQSPQVSKPCGIKPRDPTPTSFTRKVSSGNMPPTKTDKTTTDLKKITKQNSFTSIIKSTTSKNSLSHKTEPEPKHGPTLKGINKENVSPKKEDVKVTRAASDITIKTKKTSPQRMKSKPEIQVNDVSSAKLSKSTITTTTNATTTTKKSTKEPQAKLAPKPKSATALNTSTDEDNIIIDVEQAKSSRENSPDRICPTPVNFIEDVGTPRFPDEVSEPDDEFRKRTYHTIHESESIVDDIVEICEDDELFVKYTDVDRITESDECLLSVTDKVTKFTNKIESIPKSKETTTQFKDVERLVHSDFVDEKLKSDECLLSVTEKVHRFAKGPRDTKDRSPVRKITDEYDTETIYQDDYTKLSVNDKAHLFVETAETVKAPKTKPVQKIKRPNLSNVDESLKSDDCLLSVSAKVNKFVKSAEQFLNESTESKEKDQKIREEYEKIMKHITNEEDTHTMKKNQTETYDIEDNKIPEDKTPSFARETTSSHTKIKDYPSPNLKSTEKIPLVKLTTLRSSEAVKKAKALFENIASTQKTTDTKTTKLTDIGIKKSPKTDSTTALHPSAEASPNVTDIDSEVDAPQAASNSERPTNGSLNRLHQPNRFDEKLRGIPNRLSSQSPEIPRGKSPVHRTLETKTVLSRSVGQNEPPKHVHPDVIKQDNYSETEKTNVPSYQRPTKTSQVKEVNVVEEAEVSSRRGSGKFGVELRRTSVEKATMSAERRRSSTEHPCIEDIFDLDLLEQMLEKVVGYEQRRRIRAQIRVARKKMESERIDTNTYTRTKSTVVTKTRSPDRKTQTKSPDRQKPSPQRTLSPEHLRKSTPIRIGSTEHIQVKDQTKQLLNGHTKESNIISVKRSQSPEKPKSTPKTRSPTRQPSPEKKTRTSPNKVISKPKPNRFNEYASAYMKKVGLTETEKLKFADKTKKTDSLDFSKVKTTGTEDSVSANHLEEHKTVETKTMSMSRSYTERTSSKDRIEMMQMNGKRSQSPEKKRPGQHSPTERLYQRSPSPDFKRTKSDNRETITKTVYEKVSPKSVKTETVITTVKEEPKIEIKKKETIIKTVYDIEKKIPGKQVQDEKPSWMTNRNLKKISSETRTFSSKKVEVEKPKYRAASPTKVLGRTAPTPTDVITSSYGPGPLDADGRPLFGIKALRNGASNYQVKGTVIRSEYHSRNGGEPEGSMSVTAYSTTPEDLERLLQAQGDRPSRIHGLAAITTTKKFGGDSGTTLREVRTKEERAALDHFTYSDRKVTDRIHVETLDKETTPVRSTQMRDGVKGARKGSEERRDDKKTVRQSSVKSLTEKYIKSASDTSRSERGAYPKAGLILRTATMKDSLSSDSSAHAGLGRTDSEQSLGSTEEITSTTRSTQLGDHQTTTTTTSRHQSHQQQGDHQSTTTSSRHHVQQQYTPAQRTERSFLDSSTKVTGVQDILTRMKNADIVVNEGDSCEDAEARALLNKFLGASVLMAGMQGYVTEKPSGRLQVKQETVRSSSGGGTKTTTTTTCTKRIEDIDLDSCWDEQFLRKLLEESTDYEQRRRLRARIRTLMAEQEACASAVTAALGAADEAAADSGDVDAREEEEVTVTSSVRRNSSEKTLSGSTNTKTSKVIESVPRGAPKPVSPFAKFRQLEKQNSVNSPNSPKSPQSPGSPAKAPYFKFTDPALQASALTIKERLLQWCRDKTRDYENVKLENFSTSWADGLAFCALVHHFLPDAFDYSKLTPDKRRHNFTLAFKIADEKAGIYPLLDVDDMVAMRKPDWKCVFTYVQAIHRHFKDQP